MKTIVEPFRIRTVEPLRITTTDERRRAIERAHWNLFGLRARDVIGTLMFGGTDSSSGLPTPVPLDLVRLTFPRRVYTQSHFDWVLEAFEQFVQRKDELRGYRILKEPEYLRAFTAQLEPLT